MTSESDVPVTRVVVVTADPHARTRWCGLLDDAPGLAVAGTSGDGETAVGLVAATAPHVLLLGLGVTGGDGVEVCQRVVDAHPGTRVLVLTASDEPTDLLAAVRAGAAGYLLAGTPGAEVVAAVRAVAAGEGRLDPRLVRPLLEELAALSRPPEPAPWAALTAREVEVLRHLAAGRRNREIGEELYISEYTVKNHVRAILAKLALGSRHEAASWALEAGLTPSPRSGPAR